MTRRNPIVREAHLEEISRRYLRGESQSSIATALGLTQQTVSNDLKELQKRWQESALQNLDERKGAELARIDQLEREYWLAWERSQHPTEISTSKLVSGGGTGVDRNEAQLRTEQQIGDARFLQGVQWCIAQRVKILGIEAPIKQDVTTGGKPFERMSNDELIQFITSRIAATGGGG